MEGIPNKFLSCMKCWNFIRDITSKARHFSTGFVFCVAEFVYLRSLLRWVKVKVFRYKPGMALGVPGG
jgi:hypothetical protein